MTEPPAPPAPTARPTARSVQHTPDDDQTREARDATLDAARISEDETQQASYRRTQYAGEVQAATEQFYELLYQSEQTGRDYDCKEFKTHHEAQAFFEFWGGPAADPHRLDEDHDGLACEALP